MSDTDPGYFDIIYWILCRICNEKKIQLYDQFFNIFIKVISKSVADGLAHCGLNYTESTEKFIRMCDQFSNFLNVCNTFEGQIKRKPALESYRDMNDWRIKVFLII